MAEDIGPGGSRKRAPRSSSSVYTDDFSIEYLIYRVSEMKRVQELRTISTLMKENQQLRKEVIIYRRLWGGIIAIMIKSIQATKSVEKALEGFSTKTAVAERDWLAFWGIYTESVDYVGPKLPQWI
jgi:hypothetical protein